MAPSRPCRITRGANPLPSGAPDLGPPLLLPEDVAKMASISLGTVYDDVDKGRLRAVKLYRWCRFTRAEVDRYLADRGERTSRVRTSRKRARKGKK